MSPRTETPQAAWATSPGLGHPHSRRVFPHASLISSRTGSWQWHWELLLHPATPVSPTWHAALASGGLLFLWLRLTCPSISESFPRKSPRWKMQPTRSAGVEKTFTQQVIGWLPCSASMFSPSLASIPERKSAVMRLLVVGICFSWTAAHICLMVCYQVELSTRALESGPTGKQQGRWNLRRKDRRMLPSITGFAGSIVNRPSRYNHKATQLLQE